MTRFFLDVGGSVYTTTEATLRKSPTLSKLIDSTSLAEGDILFVDRDPVAFMYILMYLRNGMIYTGREDDEYVGYLMHEASHYGLRKLEGMLADVSVHRKAMLVGKGGVQ